MARRKWAARIGGINGVLLILYTAAVLTADQIMVRPSFSYVLRWVVFLIPVAILLCPALLRILGRIELGAGEPLGRQKEDLRWKILFLAVPLLYFLVFYAVFYPGAFSQDSVDQYMEVVSGRYSDWHPVLQTLFAFALPLALTGGWVGSIALFQMLVFSLALSYAFFTMARFISRRFALFAMLFILLNPQTGNMALFPWKDVSFAIGALLLTTFSLYIYYTDGSWLERPSRFLLFILTAAATTIFRHNAVLFTLPLVLAVLFCLPRRRAAAVCAGIVLLIAGIRGPVYSALRVEKPGSRQIETLGLPMTVIGAVVKYDPDALDAETKEFAYRVTPPKVWESEYALGSYNSVKWNGETDNDVIEEYGAARVITMMLRCFKNSPRTALRGLIALTNGVYSLSDNYIRYDAPFIAARSDFPYHFSGPAGLRDLFLQGTKGMMLLFPHLFLYLGSMHLALLASALAKCSLRKCSDWKRILFIVPVFAYNFGSALLLTGAGDTSRFFYYTFLQVPLLLTLFYRRQTKEGTPDA